MIPITLQRLSKRVVAVLLFAAVGCAPAESPEPEVTAATRDSLVVSGGAPGGWTVPTNFQSQKLLVELDGAVVAKLQIGAQGVLPQDRQKSRMRLAMLRIPKGRGHINDSFD